MTGFPLPPTQLEPLIAHRRRKEAQTEYALHLLWLTGLQLFTLCGGSDYPVPDPVQALAPCDTSAAPAILDRLLHRMQAERSA